MSEPHKFGKPQRIEKDGVVLWNDGIQNTDAWVDSGGKAWFIFPEERELPVDQMFNRIKNTWNNGTHYRCSGCGLVMEKVNVAAWPLFAGVACPKCKIKHDASTADQIKKGHVCTLCGKPYNNCYC